MLVWFIGALCLVASLYVTGARVLPIKLILGYATAIDVVFTVCMLGMFAGTLTGAMSAALAGLMLAVSLSVGRWVFGYDRIVLRRDHKTIGVEVVSTPGKLCQALRNLKDRVLGMRFVYKTS